MDRVASQTAPDTAGPGAARAAGPAGGAVRRRPVAALPARVQRAIRVREERSEILIGWAQAAILGVFGSLWLVSPKATGAADMAIEPVPIVLLAYGLFTALRLVLAHRRYTPAWFLILSGAVDMALLMGLIWSFHIQYAQPPAFYLKAPTLLYVFIFIALRALRFDPVYVLATGLFGAAGWLILFGFALSEAGTGGITRDYVTYMTGNLILIGAEVDKALSILVVTAILAFALHRARRLLIEAVEGRAATQELSRFFAPEVAETITSADDGISVGAGEAREAAILMVDIRGFTRVAATLEPSAAVRLLAEYEALLVPVIRTHGGSIDKFLGDGIMATFGTTGGHARYAADALAALEGVTQEGEAWAASKRAEGLPPGFAVNAAVAAGRVVFGAVGAEERLEFTVIGAPVNLAARLEKHNKALGSRAIATRTVWRLAEDQGFAPRLAWRVEEGVAVPDIPQTLDLMRVD